MHDKSPLPVVSLSTRRVTPPAAEQTSGIGKTTGGTRAGEHDAGELRKVGNEVAFAARPTIWLGAPSPFGLALPAAEPTPSGLYAPRGVWLDQQRLVVCDSGNHRVLIWNNVPQQDEQPADVVLGQMDFYREGPARGCSDYAGGMHLPTGVIVVGERLLVADAWHHRILVWNKLPAKSATPPDYAIGQSSLEQVLPNGGEPAPSASSLYWPYGLAFIHGRLYVADTGNRRVLAWEGIPEAGQPATCILGQSSALAAEENRGGSANGKSFRWPHAIAGDERHLWVADAGNHRVLGWNGHPTEDRDADWLVGQIDMSHNQEDPYRPQGPSALRFPYGLVQVGEQLLAADTANNRVLMWRLPLGSDKYARADAVIGQNDFEHNGENRWDRVERDTLCWPYGIAACGHRIAIADSGNNRVMLWESNP